MLLSGKSFRKPCTGCKNNVEYKQRISLILTQLRSSKPKMCICVEKLNQRGREEEEEEEGGGAISKDRQLQFELEVINLYSA